MRLCRGENAREYGPSLMNPVSQSGRIPKNLYHFPPGRASFRILDGTKLYLLSLRALI